MTDVATTIDITYTKLHLTEHVNPIIQGTEQHLPPPRIAGHLKRKQPRAYRRLNIYLQDKSEEC
jgi:hypothetical protein